VPRVKRFWYLLEIDLKVPQPLILAAGSTIFSPSQSSTGSRASSKNTSNQSSYRSFGSLTLYAAVFLLRSHAYSRGRMGVRFTRHVRSEKENERASESTLSTQIIHWALK